MTSLALVAGVVSFTSPCTLPLLPGYVSYISGLSRTEDRGGVLAVDSRHRVLSGAVLFTAGFTTVFTALGLTASALGLLLAQHRDAINLVGGVLITLMGLSMTGLVRLPLLHRQARPDPTRYARGPGGAVPLGAAFAFGWTPCIGPVLTSILATAASTATPARGMVLLLAYSVGLGVPFVLLARGIARGRGRVQWLRRNARRIEIAGGAVLAVMGVAVATGGWTALMSVMLGAYARVGWPPL